MNKKIEDYLHLYLGCEVTDGEHVMELLTVGKYGYVASNKDVKSQGIFDRIKPILRPLSSMTEEERQWVDEHDAFVEEYINSEAELHIEWAAQKTQYLLSHHFDLFGLIESNLAIDKTKQA